MKTLKDLEGERTLEDFNRVQDGKEESWIETKKLRQEAIEDIRELKKKIQPLDDEQKMTNFEIDHSCKIAEMEAKIEYIIKKNNITKEDLK